MSSKSFCPRCETYIAPERRVNGFAICECGWSDNTPFLLAWTKIEEATIRRLLAFAILLAAFYAHLVSWNQHAFSVPGIYALKWTDRLSGDGYRRLAAICVDLNKWTCADRAYLDLYMKKHDVSALADLASLRVRRGESERAEKAFRSYFRAGGDDPEVSYAFAHFLEQHDQAPEALHYYTQAVESSPHRFNTRATAGLLRVLMNQGQYADAYKAVVAFQRKGGVAREYFNEERSRLQRLLNRRAPASAPSVKSFQRSERGAQPLGQRLAPRRYVQR